MNKKIVYFNVLLIVFYNISLFSNISFQNKEKEKFVVVLDAGHGGNDPGNTGNGFQEKEIALKVVLAVGRALEEDERFKVVYTRDDDTFVELHERGKIANKAKADLFVSVHCNSHRSQASGTETFVLGLHANDENFNVAKNENSVILLEDNYEANYDGFDPNSPESIIGLTLMQEEYLDQSLVLASVVQDSFTNHLKRKNRGVKQAGFVVLHQTYMPSVLIELGFLTNDQEGKYLNSLKGQQDMALSIIKSIKNYKDNLEAAYFVPEPEIPVEVKVDSIASSTPEKLYLGITFKVQIGAGSNAVELIPENFNGLDKLSRHKIKDIYKYFYGNTSNYAVIKQLKTVAIKKGYESCFVVAFRNNEIISMSEALKVNNSSN